MNMQFFRTVSVVYCISFSDLRMNTQHCDDSGCSYVVAPRSQNLPESSMVPNTAEKTGNKNEIMFIYSK